MSMAEHVAAVLADFQNRHILIVGDVMLDKFISGSVERMSPEAPIPVLSHTKEHVMPGGAANVARNLASLGGRVSLIGCIGDDSAGKLLVETLSLVPQLKFFPIISPNRPTTQKTRFLASGKQILRVDDELTNPLTNVQASQLLLQAEKILRDAEVLVLSDYAKGCLSPIIINSLITAAQIENIPIITDPKSRDFAHYNGSTVLTPNLAEFQVATGIVSADHDVIADAATHLITTHNIEHLLITLSADGMMIANKNTHTHIPAYKCDVFDVSGAGDTVVAVAAATLATGRSTTDAMTLANLAASVVVGKSGTATLCPGEFIQAAMPASSETTYEDMNRLVTKWRSKELRIGFTNGCFDFLHPGHLALLAAAKERCDKLIVAVNSDASVKLLKGEMRPLMDETSRAGILECLPFVDAVIIFDDMTPARLIDALIPDSLIKGGDYIAENIIGYQTVTSAGGTVDIISLKAGYSTTALLD
jgi:D-beta-D-heptose 7-phosphate kinase / D-beta-D-heptose 1-phosphate adenosyltransferase